MPHVVVIDGLEPADAEPRFAFFAVRLETAVGRDGLLAVLRALAPLIPDVDSFIAEFPDALEDRLRIVAIPWIVPRDAATAAAQTAIVRAAVAVGIEAAWFFQTGATPPQVDDVPFPLDDRPRPDRDDFGIAFKLSGEAISGENTVILAFHALWLAPYDGQHRNTAIAFDREHRAAHLWVDRLAMQVSAQDVVAHAMWIAAMLDRVLPVLHARFVGRGAGTEAFVLGGNPLRACYRSGGEPAVDAWLAEQASWSDGEVAQMLKELAGDLVDGVGTVTDGDADDDDDDGALSDRGAASADRGCDVARYAGEVLIARARVGALDARAVPALLPVIARRRNVAALAGAAAFRPAVPALVELLDSASSIAPAAAAAAALGAIGELSAAPALAAVMTSDSHATETRIAAARALSYGPLAAELPAAGRADAVRSLAELTGDPLAAAAAAEDTARLPALLHAALTGTGADHDATVRSLGAALDVAARFPEHVRAEDLVWLTRFAEPELRAAAHRVLESLGAPLARAPEYDAVGAHGLDDAELVRAIGAPHVVGRGALIEEVGRRRMFGARRPIIGACSEVIARARPGAARLLHHDARVLEAGVGVLRGELGALEDDTISLFDRMLRNANIYVKWDLLEQPPVDARLIGGMFHVVGERWGWQELAAKRWLTRYQGTVAYEAAHEAAYATSNLAEQRRDAAPSREEDAN